MPTTSLDGVAGRCAPTFGSQPHVLARIAAHAASRRPPIASRISGCDTASVAAFGRSPFALQALAEGTLPL